jgi:hypothetical protein
MIERILINKRVCPIPTYWNELYEIIKKENQEIKIKLPLILGAWHFTDDFEKLLRFKEHLELVEIESMAYRFLISLTEENWHHENE